ncbi:UTRA domain-containing protein [Streptomyces syringium]|uniref:UTRA domain-containing protein n=1 Tax=Streptomyces syringium TaxID=76729 RepID=UPI003F515DEE
MPYLKPRDAGQPEAWAAEAAAKGRRGGQRIAHAGEVPTPPEIAELLGLPEGKAVVVRGRMMYLDEQPTELTDTYYPAPIARGIGLAGTAKVPGEAATLLATSGAWGPASART